MPSGADGKSEVLCSAVIFGDEDALDAGRPTRVLADTIVNVGVVYKQLVRTFDQGGVLAGYIGQGDETSFGTKPWKILDLDPEDQERVEQVWDQVTWPCEPARLLLLTEYRRDMIALSIYMGWNPRRSAAAEARGGWLPGWC